MSQIHGANQVTNLAELIRALNGALFVADQSIRAGEPGSGFPVNAVPHWNIARINANGLTQVFTGPCIYGGFRILGNAGGATMNIYDDVAVVASKLIDTTTVAAYADKKQAAGEKCLTGLAVNMTADPTDNLILVFYQAA